MSQIYETDEDIANEARVLSAIAERYKVEVVKCPQKYEFDAMIVKGGKVESMIEFKHRSVASTAYPTAIIGLNKALYAHNFKQATGIPCNLVVEWTDMIGMVNLKKFVNVSVGGRNDRNDPNDHQMLAHYKIEDFKKLDLF